MNAQDGFNPTTKDLYNLNEKILSLKAEKQGIIQRKLQIESSLALLQDQYPDVSFGSESFKEIKGKRANLKQSASEVELEIKKINDELNFKNNLKNEVEYYLKNTKSKESDSGQIVKELLVLKEKYRSFSKDKTRIASLRIMSSEIGDELDKLIRRHS